MSAEFGEYDSSVPASSVTGTLSLSLKVSALSLGALCVCTLFIGLASKCPPGVKRDAPLLMTVFVALLALGAWSLREPLVRSIGFLDEADADMDAHASAKRQTWTWMLCFVAVVWGGIFVLESYCVQPLAVCQEDAPQNGLVQGFLQIRGVIYTLLVIVTLVPLVMLWRKQQRLAKLAAGEGELDPTTALAETLSATEGGFKNGNTALFRAAHELAVGVGYAAAAPLEVSAGEDAL
jgi:hypothetical protein